MEVMIKYMDEHQFKPKLQQALDAVFDCDVLPTDPFEALALELTHMGSGSSKASLTSGVRKKMDLAVSEALSTPSENTELLIAGKLLEDSGNEAVAFVVRQLAKIERPIDQAASVTKFALAWKRGSGIKTVLPHPTPILEGLMMKCDEFDGIHALKSERLHPMVWNFRKARSDLPIYGVGQCHLDGLTWVATHMREAGYERAYWFNMREEPLIYLNGTASAPRVEGKLNENVDYLLSIQGHELDSMELRLCDDCLQASKRDGGLPIWFEVAGVNSQKTVEVEPQRSFSVRGAYESWVNKQEGVAQISYVRVPIADETAPEEQDFDQIVQELKQYVQLAVSAQCETLAKTALIFNCHMGRGRTTTGMVCGSILLRAALGWAPPESSPPLPDPSAEGRNLKRGEFAGILKLLAQLESTRARPGLALTSKLLVDACSDECDEVTSLVDAAAKCIDKAAAAEERIKSGAAVVPTSGLAESMGTPGFWRHRGVKYLERYAYLLLFAGYVQLAASESFEVDFSDWMKQHWAFKRTIRELQLE